MQLKEPAPAATLAHRLGDTAHVSGLAIRLARLSGAGDRLPEWLLRTAVERGAKHYQRDFDPSLPTDNPAISDEEIGIALCLGQIPHDPWFIRGAPSAPKRFRTGRGLPFCRGSRTTATRHPSGSSAVNNPLAILQTLDRRLDHPVELTLYGRAALALGFPSHELRHETPQDVDAIIPLAQLDQLRADEQFWDARDDTNAELAQRGLYMTHLFTEADVFLLSDWLRRRVLIPGPFTQLRLHRPATLDLILTKMMRGVSRCPTQGLGTREAMTTSA